MMYTGAYIKEPWRLQVTWPDVVFQETLKDVVTVTILWPLKESRRGGFGEENTNRGKAPQDVVAFQV